MKTAVGFSLIEVMVSLTILAMALMAINTMQMTSVSANLRNFSFLEAIKVGADITEQIKAAASDDELIGANGMIQKQKIRSILEVDSLSTLGANFRFHGLSEGSDLNDTEYPGFTDAGDVHLWHGEARTVSQGIGHSVVRRYAVRAVFDTDFAPGSGFTTVYASRGMVTVFWPAEAELRHINIPFYIGNL